MVIYFAHAFPCANRHYTDLKNLSNTFSTLQLPYTIPFRPSTSEDWTSPLPRVGTGPWHWHRARCLQQSRSCWGQPRYPEEVIWDSETWWNIQLSLADLLYNWRDWNCLITGSLQNITPPSKYSEGRSIESSLIFRYALMLCSPPCLVCLSPGPNGTDSEATSEIDEGVGNHLFTVESASTASRSSFGQWEAAFVTRVGRIWERRLVSLGKTKHDKCLQDFTSVTRRKYELEDPWRKNMMEGLIRV